MEMIDSRTCAGCDFITPEPISMLLNRETFYCKRTASEPVIDPVLGREEVEYQKCVDERSSTGKCGPDGKFWKNDERLKRIEEYREYEKRLYEEHEKRLRNRSMFRRICDWLKGWGLI